jgi:hypothetical protein
MKCKQCQKEFEPKRKDAQFCSPSCRALFNRKSKDKPYSYTGEKLYGRKEVIFKAEETGTINSLGASWKTRPESDNETDKPDPDNRNIYTDSNNNEYLIDATGHSSMRAK